MTPAALLGAQLGIVLVAVAAAWVVAVRRLPARWADVGWGALTFPLSQIARMAVVVPAGIGLTSWLGPRAGTAQMVLLVVTAGVFEESARWLVLRRWATRTRSWAGGVAFGLGHGGIEAVLLMGSAAVNGLVLLATADTVRAALAAQDPDRLAAFDDQVQALQNLSPALAAAGVYERALAVVVHVAFTLLVLRGVRQGDRRWWAAAVALHCAVDAVAVGLMPAGTVAVEAALTVVAAALLLAVLRGPLSRRVVSDPARGQRDSSLPS